MNVSVIFPLSDSYLDEDVDGHGVADDAEDGDRREEDALRDKGRMNMD